jgi:hypothetical protein
MGKLILSALMVGVTALLSACGGGGGSSEPPPAPPPPPPTFSITGAVSGLNGTVVLQRNSANDQTVTANGAVTLGSALASGSAYTITVLTQPANPAQTCVVTNGTGTLSANVSNVTITCTSIPLALSSSSPATGATAVPRNVTPTLTFSRPLDAATVIPGNFTLTSAAGAQAVTVSAAGATATVTSANRLLPITEYTLVVGTALRGAAAEQLPSGPRVTFTTADLSWGSATLVENLTAGSAGNPDIQFDGSGNAIAVWHMHDGTRFNIYSNRFTPGTGWGTPQLIEANNAGDASQAQVAVNASGQALAVWQHSDGTLTNIMSNRYVPGTGWGAPQLLETASGDATLPRVGIDPQGNGYAIWEQGVGTSTNVYMSRFDASSGWTARVALGVVAFGASASPDVAVDSNGDAHFIWTQVDLMGLRSVLVNRYVRGVGLGASTLVEQNDDGQATGPHVVVDAQNNAMAIWSSSANGANDLWTVRFTPTGGWAAPEHVETGAGSTGNGRVALNSAGDGFAVWTQFDGTRTDIWANRFTASVGWGTATLVEHDDAGDATSPQVLVDAAGNALAVWRQSDGSFFNTLASRFVGGTWSTPVFLELSTASVSSSPQLAMDASGNAIALWSQSDGTNLSIWSNRFE